MSNSEMLGRRGEILKRNIGRMLVQDNRSELGEQDYYLLQKLIKELHQNQYELNSHKDS